MQARLLTGAHVRQLATFAGLILASLLVDGSVCAQDTEEKLAEPEQVYLVELLFFLHQGDAGGTLEEWSPRPLEPEPEPEPELETEPEVFEITEEMLAAEELKRSIAESLVRARRSEFQLLAVSSKLASSRYYEPIAHVGWTQPGYLLDIAQPFSIENALAGQGTLSGSATFSKGRYLRLDVDIEYRPQGSFSLVAGREENQFAGGLSEQLSSTPVYYIVEQRRSIKSNEIHYFDNPTFGIVARITPLLSDETEEGLPAEPATASR